MKPINSKKDVVQLDLVSRSIDWYISYKAKRPIVVRTGMNYKICFEQPFLIKWAKVKEDEFCKLDHKKLNLCSL